MKKSTRYLNASLVGAAALLVGWVGLSRLYGQVGEPYVPPRTSAEDLAALSGFSRVELRGDFQVEMISGDSYAVEYLPPGPERGELRARQEGEALFLEGFGNRRNDDGEGGVLRIVLPRLEALSISFAPSATLEGFRGTGLSLSVVAVESLTLRGNDVDTLQLSARGRGTVRLEGNRLGASALELNGAYRLEVAD